MSFNLPIASDKATHIVVYHTDPPAAATASSSSSNSNEVAELRKQIYDLTKEMNELTKRVLHIELAPEEKKQVVEDLPRKSPYFAPAVAPEPSGLEVRRLSEEVIPVDTSNSKQVFESLMKTDTLEEEKVEDIPEPDDEVEEEEEVVEEEEEVVEEEEGEAMELEEFEYKGVTYYRDGENQVYQKDEEGDLDDTPIGVWNEVKQKVIKYAK